MISGAESDSSAGETFKLTEPNVRSKRHSINAFAIDIFNCQLCHNRVTLPRDLPCLHTFCSSCLDSYILNSHGRAKCYFPCPTCKTIHTNPMYASATFGKKDSIDSMALVLRRPMTTASTLLDDKISRSDSQAVAYQLRHVDRRCHPCLQSSDIVPAIFWCPTCREALCDGCTKSHRGMRITKGHALMDIDDAGERPHRMIRPYEACPEHRGKLMEMYCHKHQCAICATCAAINHRFCDTVIGFNRMARNMRAKKMDNALMQRLRRCVASIDSILAATEASKDRLVARKMAILTEVSKVRNSVIILLDNLEDKLKEDLHIASMDYEEQMDARAERSQGLRNSIMSTLRSLDNTLATGSDYQQILAQPTIQEECVKYETMIDEERMEFKELDLVFTPNEQIVKLAMLVDRMGTIETTDNVQTLNSFRESLAQKIKSFYGKVKGDRNGCIFNSVDIAPSGEIVLSDFNNLSVKLFDQFGSYRSCTKLNTPPRGACFLQAEKVVAISLPEECVLKLMSFDDNYLVQKHELRSVFRTYRISEFEGKLLGICYNKPVRSLSIIGRTGRIERSLSKKRDVKGTGGVAYDSVKKHIYMSDRDTVSCFNYDGSLVYQNAYRRTDLRGMALDFQGNLYVCSHDSGQILQIGPDGRLIKPITVAVSPQDVAIEPHGNKLVVVGLGDSVHVYNLV